MKKRFSLFITLCVFYSLCFTQEKIVKYYPDGKAEYEGYHINGILDSSYTEYYKNGKIKTSGFYKQGEYKTNTTKIVAGPSKPDITINNGGNDYKRYYGNKHGKWIHYYESGKIKSEHNYIFDIRQGESLYYYEDGQIHYRDFYSAGNYISSQEYYPDGTVKEIFYTTADSTGGLTEHRLRYYRSGILGSIHAQNKTPDEKGTYTGYWENGYPSEKEFFSGNSRNGLCRYYNENGDLVYEGIYRNDEPVGTHFSFDTEKRKWILTEWKDREIISETEKDYETDIK